MRALGEALALWLYERGVREDICAASLKTNWLDSGASDSRTGGPAQAAAARPLTPSSSLEKPTIEADLALTAAPGRRKRALALIRAALLLALALGVLLFALRRRQPESPASDALPAHERAPTIVIEPPPPSGPTEPTLAPVLPPTATAGATATAPRSVAMDAGAKRAPRLKATKAQPRTSPDNSKDPDLGF